MTQHHLIRCAFLVVATLCAAPAAAQGLLDNGLPKEAPTEVAYHLGPFSISPTFSLSQLGVDTNVFHESVNPKRDYVIGLSPSLRAYARFGMAQVVLDSSTDVTWYAKYASERALGRALKGRADLVVSRIRGSIGGGIVQTRERPGQEIELRARRIEREMWAGTSFEVSPLLTVYTSAHRSELEFKDDEVFRGTDLAQALNRTADSIEAGVSLRATPFTTLVVSGRNTTDRFVSETRRNSDSQSARAELTFSKDAMIQGRAAIGYRQFRPVDPEISDFKGLVSTAGLSFTGFWGGHLDFDAARDVSYSYDVSDGFYLGTKAVASYTQRLVGAFDVSSRYGIGRMDYGNRVGLDPRLDTTTTYAGGFGYNRSNGGRFGLAYEYEVRGSDTRADRRYITRRLFGSYTHTVIR